REHLLRTEPNCVRQQLRIVDRGNVDDAYADPVRGHAEPDAAAGQAVRDEEPLERLSKGFRIPNLARTDDTVRKRRACELPQLGGAVVVDDGGSELRRADPQ